jgi:hypothetical protein
VLGHQQQRVARPRAGALRGRAGELGLLQGAVLPLLRLLVLALMLRRLLSALQLLALGRGFEQLLALEPLVAG